VTDFSRDWKVTTKRRVNDDYDTVTGNSQWKKYSFSVSKKEEDAYISVEFYTRENYSPTCKFNQKYMSLRLFGN
jgi:hypothetical protein